MRYAASEKAEIIQLVDNRSCRPSARWTSSAYPAPRSIAGMIDIVEVALRRWLTTVPDRTVSGIASLTTSAARSSIWRWSSRSCRRGSWRCASPTRESILSPRLRSIGC